MSLALLKGFFLLKKGVFPVWWSGPEFMCVYETIMIRTGSVITTDMEKKVRLMLIIVPS